MENQITPDSTTEIVLYLNDNRKDSLTGMHLKYTILRVSHYYVLAFISRANNKFFSACLFGPDF